MRDSPPLPKRTKCGLNKDFPSPYCFYKNFLLFYGTSIIKPEEIKTLPLKLGIPQGACAAFLPGCTVFNVRPSEEEKK